MAAMEGINQLKEWNETKASTIEQGERLTFEEVEIQSLQAQEQFAEHPLVKGDGEKLGPSDEQIEKLGKEYERDLKELSPYPETISEQDVTEWGRQSPEDVREARQEFNSKREGLIKEWELVHGKEWPRYEEDIYSNNGVLIREKGDLYDAHHVQPLEVGGQNTADNITPLHAEDHYDRQGIHSMTSVYQEIKDKLL